MIAKTFKFIGDVRQEMSKVIWPTRAELQGSAVMVILLSLILTIFVFAIDFILNNALKAVL